MNWNSTEFIWLDWLVLAVGVMAIVWAVYRTIKKDHEKMKGADSLFVLIGNAERPAEPEVDNIKVIEDANDNIDLPLDTEIEDESAKEIDPLTFEL